MTFIAVTPGEGGLNGRKPGAFYAEAAPQLDATGPGGRKDGRRRKAASGGPARRPRRVAPAPIWPCAIAPPESTWPRRIRCTRYTYCLCLSPPCLCLYL